MPLKISTADRIIELCNQKGVSIYLDGSRDSDPAKIGTPYTYSTKNKVLNILLVNLKSSTKEKLIPFFKEKWEELGIIIKKSAEETLEYYLNYRESATDKEIIDFFTDKIPFADLDALKMSLFLRYESLLGRDISLYKQQIRERFGERGTYISNLCTSGYFEDDFMPYYEQNPAQFDRYYELTVGKELRAIFVHTGMTKSTFENILEVRLLLARRYSLNSFRIHGFGIKNVNLIKDALKNFKSLDEKIEENFTINEIEEKETPPSIIFEVILIPYSSQG